MIIIMKHNKIIIHDSTIIALNYCKHKLHVAIIIHMPAGAYTQDYTDSEMTLSPSHVYNNIIKFLIFCINKSQTYIVQVYCNDEHVMYYHNH